jgi:glycerol kinase
MPTEFILTIDQGTTNTKALLVDREGRVKFRTSVPVQLLQPAMGFVEQDPCELWSSVCQVIGQCVSHVEEAGAKVEGIVISNQRETAVAWHRLDPASRRDPTPLGKAISWQCRRSETVCDRLRPHAQLIRARSGLLLDPLITAGKWAWMLENSVEVQQAATNGNICFGNVDSWLLYNLTGGRAHATDHSNASRTGLFGLESLFWDNETLEHFGIPQSALPRVSFSASEFGICTTIPGLLGVPIVALIGDSHAALAGHGSYVSGTIKATYGTGSSVITLTSTLPLESPSLARTIAWSADGQIQFALEGNISMTGSAVQWVGEFLGLSNPIAGAIALSETVPDAAGLLFVPAMVGLGAPYWDSEARGILANLGRSHTAAHLARAGVDSIAHQIADVFFAMEEACGQELPTMRADGGATRNRFLMQFQADVLGRPVLRARTEELSALGAAALGGLTLGWWTSLNRFGVLTEPAEVFEPSITSEERERFRAAWKQAIRRARLGNREATE